MNVETIAEKAMSQMKLICVYNFDERDLMIGLSDRVNNFVHNTGVLITETGSGQSDYVSYVIANTERASLNNADDVAIAIYEAQAMVGETMLLNDARLSSIQRRICLGVIMTLAARSVTKNYHIMTDHNQIDLNFLMAQKAELII